MFLILRIHRSYLEQVELIFPQHPPETVLHIVFVGLVRNCGT